MFSALVAMLLTAAPSKVAVMTLEAGEGVPPKTAQAISEAVISEVRRVPSISVVTPAEIATLLGFERQKQLLGCKEDTSCMAEVGSALGVDRLLMGSVSKLGQSWLLHLKLLDASKGSAVGQSDRRLKDKAIDDVLDALPAMVTEVFGKAPGAALTPPPATAQMPMGAAAKLESGGQDEPAEVAPEVMNRFTLLTDGKGNFIAVTAYGGTDTPVFAGDAQKLYAQRIIGGGAEGDIRFNLIFWDPRIPAGYQRGLDMKDGKYQLQCGDKVIPYQVVPAAKAKTQLKKLKLLKPRWRRAALALARDDFGNYFVVDGPRDDKDTSTAVRLLVGPKGKLRPIALDDVIDDAKSMLLISSEGRLRIPTSGDSAEWIDGKGTSQKLVRYELGPQEAKLIYKDLGLYRDDPLKTACDPHL